MSKKSVLILGTSMSIGGVERALVSLLNSFPYEQYNVTLWLTDKSGEFLDLIPETVKCEQIKTRNGYDISKGFKSCIIKLVRNHRYGKLITLVLSLGVYRYFGNSFLVRKMILDIDQTYYDFVLNFFGPNSVSNIICEDIVDCKKKYTWVHNEFEKAGTDIRQNNKHYKQYNNIFCVSKLVGNEMKRAYPELNDRIATLYNIVNRKYILSMANKGDGFTKTDSKIILSVGRLHMQKGFDIAIEAAKILKNKNIDFKWYIIGEGEEYSNLKKMIKEYNLENNFKLIGARSNPYPYFKTCDIYVQPSRFEGYCITLAESRVFAKPAIVTNFAGAEEQIKNEVNGLIVGISPEKIANSITSLINNNRIYKAIENNLILENDNNDLFEPIKKYLTF